MAQIFDDYQPQDIPFVCPNCNYWMSEKNIIAEGEYPLHVFRAKADTRAIGFECPICFVKSVCHKI